MYNYKIYKCWYIIYKFWYMKDVILFLPTKSVWQRDYFSHILTTSVIIQIVITQSATLTYTFLFLLLDTTLRSFLAIFFSSLMNWISVSISLLKGNVGSEARLPAFKSLRYHLLFLTLDKWLNLFASWCPCP